MIYSLCEQVTDTHMFTKIAWPGVYFINKDLPPVLILLTADQFEMIRRVLTQKTGVYVDLFVNCIFYFLHF